MGSDDVGSMGESGDTEPVHQLDDLTTHIYADGADIAGILEMYRKPYIKGFTTNPTLMRKAGVTDYAVFAREVLAAVPDRPISFEVLSDDFAEMEFQALRLAALGENVFVKIPVTDTRGRTATPLVRRLADRGVRMNVTALTTLSQVHEVTAALVDAPESFISVFAGRIADTGRDPVPMMTEALQVMRRAPRSRLIWASPREVLNIFQANAIGCHVITVTNDILKKLPIVGRDLDQYSLDTVKMFHDDANAAGFRL